MADSQTKIKLTSFSIDYKNTITKKANGSTCLKWLTRNSMKDLQIFNIFIWKKVFQINHLSNYFGGASFLQFPTNQFVSSKLQFLNFFAIILELYKSACKTNNRMILFIYLDLKNLFQSSYIWLQTQWSLEVKNLYLVSWKLIYFMVIIC